MLGQLNPDRRLNSDVVRPWLNGLGMRGGRPERWIIDFPPGISETEASLYEAPFEYILKHVRPMRATARSGDRTGVPWWIHQRPRTEMRSALIGLKRYICTTRHSKFRLFMWVDERTLADSAMIAFARDDDYFFGVLHSRAHELWALALGSQLEDRPRYTPTTCFETFPLPWAPGAEPKEDPRVVAVGEAAAEFDRLRTGWLNPPPESVTEEQLKKRTLTNLYNQRPTWLDNAHRNLDRAVFAAYGWPEDLTNEEILARLLALNLERAGIASADESAEPEDAEP